jgi:hypothetical protein
MTKISNYSWYSWAEFQKFNNWIKKLLEFTVKTFKTQHNFKELQKATKNLEPIYKSFYDNLFINDDIEEKVEE